MEKKVDKNSLWYHQNWLIVVVVFLVAIFSIRFGILLQRSQQDFWLIATQIKYGKILVKKEIATVASWTNSTWNIDKNDMMKWIQIDSWITH